MKTIRIIPRIEVVVESYPGFLPGVERDVPEELGRVLIERGQADEVKEKKTAKPSTKTASKEAE